MNAIDEEKEIERFQEDIANLGEHYAEYVILAKSRSGVLRWRSSDKTWAIGACKRYITCEDERDREGERKFLDY